MRLHGGDAVGVGMLVAHAGQDRKCEKANETEQKDMTLAGRINVDTSRLGGGPRARGRAS